jgi:hypothetical protein
MVAQTHMPVSRQGVLSPFRDSSAVLLLLIMCQLSSSILFWYCFGAKLLGLYIVLWVYLFTARKRRDLAAFGAALRRYSRETLCYTVWVMVVILNAISDRGPASYQHLLFTILPFCIYIISLDVSTRNPRACRIIIVVMAAIIAAESALAIPTLIAHPMIAKVTLVDAETAKAMALYGVGSFHLYNANTLLIPFILCLAFTFRGWRRILLIICAVTIAIAVAVSTYMMAAVLLLTGGALTGFLAVWYGRRRYLPYMLVACVCLVLVLPRLHSALTALEAYEMMTGRMGRTVAAVTTEGVVSADDSTRAERILTSASTFAEHPFLGVGPFSYADAHSADPQDMGVSIGGHSSWMDHLAEYGIIGFICYLLFVFLIGKRVLRPLISGRAPTPIQMALGVLYVLYLIGGVVNPIVMIIHTQTFFLFLTLTGLQMNTLGQEHRRPYRSYRYQLPVRRRLVNPPVTR